MSPTVVHPEYAGEGSGYKGTPAERFERKVDRTGECHVWTGSRSSDGYGTFWFNGRVAGAHRVAWELAHGPIPDSREIDHLCRNPACVRVDHLEPVTGSENQLRGINPTLTRARAAALTECVRGHPFTPENTYVNPTNGTRHCRPCAAAYQRRLRARRREATCA